MQDDQQGDHPENRFSQFEEKYRGSSSLDLVKSMNVMAGVKEDIEEQLKAVQAEYDFLRLVLIPKKFEQDGIENLKVEGIGRVSLTGDMYVSIPAAKKEEAYEFFRDIGKGSLITTTINPSTLKAAVKAMVKGGEELPAALIKITPFTRASITKR